jgi:acetylornithine/succinyldiaminopimelate/putrescine aminotransferase
MTLAKGLGGGVPLAALAAHRDVCCFEYGDQGGTFCGNPLMAAVGCAVIESVTEPGFLARVTEAGEYLAARLHALSLRHGCGEVRGEAFCWRSTWGVTSRRRLPLRRWRVGCWSMRRVRIRCGSCLR